MIEASRAQELLLVQSVKIDRLKNVVKQLELKLVGLSVTNTQLEAALRDLSEGWECCAVSKAMRRVARKALEGEDDV